MVEEYLPKTLYLVDISNDGRLDVVVWGVKVDGEGEVEENCLVAFVRQD